MQSSAGSTGCVHPGHASVQEQLHTAHCMLRTCHNSMQHAHFVVVVVVVAVVVVVVVPSVVPSNDSPGLHVGSTGAAAGALSP
jgi:hypothetical protein